MTGRSYLLTTTAGMHAEGDYQWCAGMHAEEIMLRHVAHCICFLFTDLACELLFKFLLFK